MGKLIIPHEDLASWIPLNNTFGRGHAAWKYRCGVLVQLGAFESHQGTPSPISPFGSVVFQRPDGSTSFLNRGDFDWINIVAKSWASSPVIDMSNAEVVAPLKGKFEFDSPFQIQVPWVVLSTDEPMRPRDAFFLYPNNARVTTCDALQPAPGTEKCYRMRKIDAHQLAVEGIITFWQSSSGSYTLTGSQISGEGGRKNSYVFSTNDEVQVTAYKRQGDDMVVLPGYEFEKGIISKVIVIPAPYSTPPTGDHQQPPWPTRP